MRWFRDQLHSINYRHVIPGLLLLVLLPLTNAIATVSTYGTPPMKGTNLEHPLQPPDTSSPRATLQTFLDEVSKGWRFYLEHGQGRPSKRWRAMQCLDLSEIPEVQRKAVGLEAGLLLFDVFNRIPLPAMTDVPDEDQMNSREETSWTVPHTSITIARIADGPRAGEWLFTPRTVDRAADFYHKTRHLPLKPDAVIEDGYSIYRGQTGWLIPPALHAVLPESAHQVYYDQTLWQWFLLAVVLALTALVAWSIIGWSRRVEPGAKASSARVLAGPVILILLSYLSLYLIDQQVNITGDTLAVFQHLFDSMFYLAAAWAAMLVGRLFIDAILQSTRVDLTRLSADFVRLIVRLLSFVVVLIIAAVWLNSLGIPVLGVIAGLGIGGIAVALAAQRTIENFFGAIMLYSDRPVRIGDVCRFGDKVGTVERIGLRSTRVRTPERTVLNVPNAEFSRFQLENLAKRDKLLFRTTLNLRLETTSEQLQTVLYRVRGLLLEHDQVDDDPARVRLVAIGPLSLDVEIFAYIKTDDWSKFLSIREDIFFEILREVEEAGTALAPPAQLQYNESANPIGAGVEDSSNSGIPDRVKPT